MTRTSAELAADWLRQHVATIGDLLPAWQATINRELAAHDGLPTVASGADRSRGNGGTTTVEAAVIARTPTIDHLWDICDRLDTTCTVLRGVAHDMRRHIGPVPHAPPPLCDGRGYEGFHEWGEACERTADKAGLCSMHYMRCYRWRQEHGLRPLSDPESCNRP